MACPPGYRVKSFLGFNKKCVLCEPNDDCFNATIYGNSSPTLPYSKPTTAESDPCDGVADEDLLDCLANGGNGYAANTPSSNRGSKLLDGIFEKVPGWLDALVTNKIGTTSTNTDPREGAYEWDQGTPAPEKKNTKLVLIIGGVLGFLLLLFLLLKSKKGKRK